MPFFPMFTNLEDKNILVVGGGVVASRKIQTLLHFKPKNITVISKMANEYIEELAKEWTVIFHKREFRKEDLENNDIVIVAANDINLQANIFDMCKKKNIPINCVDSPDYCSFIFPSVIVREDFVIGISTSTKAPSVSKGMRQFLEKIIPEDIDTIVKDVATIRNSPLNETEKSRAILYIVKKRLQMQEFI